MRRIGKWTRKPIFFFLLVGQIFLPVTRSEAQTRSGGTDGREPKHSPSQDSEGMMGESMQRHMEEMMGSMMGNGAMMQNMMRDMGPIHRLLMQHEKITRRVKDIPNGIESWTESNDPEVSRLIQTHVRQMKERVEDGRPIRMMDPVFQEIFKNHEKIKIRVEDTPKGVHVVETSRDPNIVKLIRQHAHKAVSEFVEHGMSRAMKPTKLPEGYQPVQQ